MLKEIQQKVIDLFKADSRLAKPGKVKEWYFGVPASPVAYPYGYVTMLGGPVKEWTWDEKEFRADILCVIRDRQPAEDVCEKNVQDLSEAMREVLSAKPTLDGLVCLAELVGWSFDKVPEEGGTVYNGYVTLRVLKLLIG